MILCYNRYQSEEPIGGSLAYQDISNFLTNQKKVNIKIIPHNFANLILCKDKLPRLNKKDVVLSTVGPYAWFYHYLRDKHKQKFRIIHDARTALFTDYFLQELLCSQYLKEGDVVLFNSEYQRQLYLKFFPEHLTKDNTFVCYPGFVSNFPKINVSKEKNKEELILCNIGRITGEKNFEQVIETFIRVSKQMTDFKVKLVICGGTDSKYKPEIIKVFLEKQGINKNNYFHVNNGRYLEHGKIWDVLKNTDIFLFPSVFSGESLARVVLEANHVGIPVIAGHHAAIPELISKKNLVDVIYSDKIHDLTPKEAIGKVNMPQMVEKCCNFEKLSKKNHLKRYKGYDKKIFDIIKGYNVKSEKIALDNKTKKFIKSVNIFFTKPLSSSSNEMNKRAINFLKKHALSNPIDIIKTSKNLQKHLDFYPKFKLMLN